MNVFIPGYGYDYDGDYTFGAYSTYEAAFDKLVREACFKYGDGYHPNGYYHISGDAWFVRVYDLDVDNATDCYDLTSKEVLDRFKELEQD